jgi:hypothetical protein
MRSDEPCGLNGNPTRKAMKLSDRICYCFGYSARDIEKDYRQNGRSIIMEKIQYEKKLGGCQCATKNPKGR